MASCSNSGRGRQLGFPTLRLVPASNPSENRGHGSSVLGMLLSDKRIKNNVIQNVLKEAWGRFRPVRFTEVNEATLMFDFESSKDIDQALDLSLWSVHGHCLNLKFCPNYVSVTEIEFSKVQVWVQVHGISLEMFTKDNATSIGESIGRCIKVEEDQILQQRTYLRIQVEVDSEEPLLPGFKWIDSRNQEKWASVRYERLTDICYGCGKIGHNSTSCPEQAIAQDDNGDPIYGSWISVSRPRALSRWVNIGGSRDEVKKKVRDWIKEPSFINQQWHWANGTSSAGHSQAASNPSTPLPDSGSMDNTVPVQEADLSMGSGSLHDHEAQLPQPEGG